MRERAAVEAKPVVFLHVMKCGGTSVRAALAEGVVGRRSDPAIFELDGQAAARAAGGTDQDNWRFRDALLRYVLEAVQPRLVLGHFRYRDEHEDLLDRAHYVTLLRDPVDRLVSLYRYRRYKDDVDVRVTMPFDEFLASSRWSKEGHLYVRTFCGRDDLDPTSDEAVEAAVRNLLRLSVVGVTERTGDFGRRVSDAVGRRVAIPVLNTSPAPADDPEAHIDAASLERAREVCEPDRRVYEQVAAALGFSPSAA